MYIVCDLSVFGTKTISSDKGVNRYFGHILVTLFCQESVEISI